MPQNIDNRVVRLPYYLTKFGQNSATVVEHSGKAKLRKIRQIKQKNVGQSGPLLR